MARKSSPRPEADEPESRLDETADSGTAPSDATRPVDADTADSSEEQASGDVAATPEAAEPEPDRSLWSQARIDPVEIALPSGVGYTLRAYRLSTGLTPTDISDREDDDPFDRRAAVEVDEEELPEFADEDLEAAAMAAGAAEAEGADDGEERDHGDKNAADDADGEGDDEERADGEGDSKDTDEEDEDNEEENEEEAPAEEVPVFLTHRGKLLLFTRRESLVDFVRANGPTDLAQADGWETLVERLQPADVVPLEQDTYELDLVVENLRGGHDAWDPVLLIKAGEVARDLAYALRLPSVLDTLSAGSSLDDLDDALRAAVDGGLRGFMGRRRLRKIGAQTASLGWRTIIGKISAAVDWRD